MLDAATGEQVGPVVSGSSDRIDASPQLEAIRHRAGKFHVHFHTHPGNSSFSDLDVAFLITSQSIRTIVVAGLDGRWYAMSKREPCAEWHEAADAFRAELLRLLDDIQVASSERPHAIWLRTSDRLGLQYDRYGGPSL